METGPGCLQTELSVRGLAPALAGGAPLAPPRSRAREGPRHKPAVKRLHLETAQRQQVLHLVAEYVAQAQVALHARDDGCVVRESHVLPNLVELLLGRAVLAGEPVLALVVACRPTLPEVPLRGLPAGDDRQIRVEDVERQPAAFRQVLADVRKAGFLVRDRQEMEEGTEGDDHQAEALVEAEV